MCLPRRLHDERGRKVRVRRLFNPFVLGGSHQRSVIDPEAHTIDHTSLSDGTGLRRFDPLQAMAKAGIPPEQRKLLNFLVTKNTYHLGSPQVDQHSQPLLHLRQLRLHLEDMTVGYPGHPTPTLRQRSTLPLAAGCRSTVFS